MAPKVGVVGGYSDAKDATPDIQKLCDQVKSQVQGKTNTTLGVFKAVKYRSQVVKGTNYLIKVHVSETNYIHLKVYHKLPCDGGAVELSGVQDHHAKDDPLAPF